MSHLNNVKKAELFNNLLGEKNELDRMCLFQAMRHQRFAEWHANCARYWLGLEEKNVTSE